MALPWEKGPVTFARFMEYCLYDPENGYYRNRNRIFGKDGDFFTSPYTHPVFAEVLANFAKAVFQSFPEGRLQLVELGAGEAQLGRVVADLLGRRSPELGERLDYFPVEIDSPELPARIRGLVLCNEFFDALPVHRLRVCGARLREIYVTHRDGAFHETAGDLSDPRIESWMRQAFPVWREGNVYEANLRMTEILEGLDRRIESAALLTIDYGYDWAEYDSRDRPDGTLMCYRQHRAHPDPYVDVGRQDLTAHVNFDVVQGRGRQLGWERCPLRSQREFLMTWGLAEQLEREEARGLFSSERLPDRLALKQLLEPGGISDTMKALVQVVRLPAAPLCGGGG